MKSGIYIGLAIGLLTGAMLACNNSKVRTMVGDAQEKIKTKIKQHGAEAMNGACECACETFGFEQQPENAQNAQG